MPPPLTLHFSSGEIAPITELGSICKHLLKGALSRDEAERDAGRFQAALAPAEADRHPCAALHTRSTNCIAG